MAFDEEEAKAILSELNLHPKTLSVWKSRGKIPPKHLRGKLRREGPVDETAKEKLLEVLANRKINKLHFFKRLETVNYSQFASVVFGKVRLDKVQYLEIVARLEDLRAELHKLSENPRIKHDLLQFLREHPEVRGSKLLGKEAVDRSRGNFYNRDENFYKQRIALFLSETEL